KKVDILRIGTTNVLIENVEEGTEETARETFRDFIKSETGFTNEILQVVNYEILAERLADGKMHLGVFMGYEFAWAQAKHAKLKPLAIAVNTYPYREAHLLVHQDNKAKDFAGLKGQSLGLPRIGLPYMRLYVDRQCQASGSEAKTFFSQVNTLDN